MAPPQTTLFLLGPLTGSFCHSWDSFVVLRAEFIQLRVRLDLVIQQGWGASECGGDLIEGATACLGYLEVGEA